MRVGLVIDGTDRFVLPIEAELKRRHRCERFAPRFVRMPLIGKRVNDWLLRRQMAQLISRNDVTFFEWAGHLLALAASLPRRGHIVARLHSVELATAANLVDWPKVDIVIVLNRAIGSRLEEIALEAWGSPQATRIVANGVALDQFRPCERSFQHRLGMVCTVIPIKRVYEAILAVHGLREQSVPYTLRIAGDWGKGENQRYRWAVERLISRLGLGQIVRLDGFVSDISRWYDQVDVFLSNSYWEGQQMALLEAMASGCYCLAHCWEGVEEILPPENIYVGDSELRAKLLHYATLSPEAQAAERARLREIAEERFDERRMVREIVALIEETAGRSR